MMSVVALLFAICILGGVVLFSQGNDQKNSFSRSNVASTTMVSTTPPSIDPTLPVHTVGQVTRHAAQYVGKRILIKGYLLKKESGYIIFSDETAGTITSYDLPIMGQGVGFIQRDRLYLVEGTFFDRGLVSSNHNLYHLELSATPRALN